MKPTAEVTAEEQVDMLIRENEGLREKLEKVDESFALLCDLFGNVRAEMVEMASHPPLSDKRPAELSIAQLHEIQKVRAEEKALRQGLQEKDWKPPMLDED